MKAPVENYLLSIGYTKATHPDFMDEYKLIRPLGDGGLISAITVFDDGAVQLMCLYDDVEEHELTYWNEARTVYDMHVIRPDLEEFKVVEGLLTRDR